MRRAALVLLGSSFFAGAFGVAAAREPVFRDAFWDVSLDGDSLAPRPRVGGPEQLFAGVLADGVAVEVLVLEEDDERDVAAWGRDLAARWHKEGRDTAGVAAADGALAFTEAGLAGAPRRHAYRLVARGVHCFVAHAVGKPGQDVRGAFAGFEVGPRRGASLATLAVARETGVDPTEPRVVIQTLQRFVQDEEHPQPAVAAEIVTGVVLAAPAGTFSADDAWSSCLSVGLMYLKQRVNAPAVEWLRRARERAETTRDKRRALAITVYNLACAHAVAGDKDAAFAALDELVAAGLWQPQAQWAQEDEDLAPLRADERWAKLPKPQEK